MSKVFPVEPDQFFDFVGRPGVVVLFVSIHRSHPFNYALSRHFEFEQGDEVLFGVVDLLDLVLFANPALAFLQRGLAACGGPRYLGAPPGYWLFRGGQIVAWHPGLPAPADAKAMANGALLGAIWSGVTRDLEFIVKGLYYAMEEAAGQRMAFVFREALAGRRSHAWRDAWSPPRASTEDLRAAYQVLGVSPSATEREVNEAWRRLRVEAHPDRAALDPDEFARRSRLSAQINHARDVILNHRAGFGQQATA